MAQPPLRSLSVFLPCFNEAPNLSPLLLQLVKLLPQCARQYEIIVIDDGSSDQTRTIVRALSQKHSHIKLVTHPTNLGYGAAIRSGIQAAKYAWIFYTDGDGQFDVTELKQFLPHAQTHQAVIGYRPKRAEGILRTFNASLFKYAVNLVFRVRAKDIDCAFKLIQADLLKSMPLISTGAMISTEILYRLKKKHITWKQLPVSHLPRQHGTPTGNHPKVILKAFVEAFVLYLHIKFPKKQA